MDDQQVWTFERASERLVVRRPGGPEGCEIEIKAAGGDLKVHRFDDEDKLNAFQSDLQYMLVHTGWKLLEFKPDRRTYRDRRGFPRIENERRRWWTDGLRAARETFSRGLKKRPTQNPT